MLRGFVKSSFEALPSSIRYHLYKHLRPESFRQLQKLREVEVTARASLKSFDQHKCIFIHIPKCAGVAVSTALFNNLAGGHATARQYQLIFSPTDFANYFKFAVVRNPWDRLVSAFHFLKGGGMDEVDRSWAAENLAPFDNFNDFVTQWVNKNNVRTEIHLRPQVEFLCRRNTLLVDFVGYFENLEHDFGCISSRLGMGDKILRKMNSSKRIDYKDYYTEQTKRIVADVYWDDIRVLGYNFDNSPTTHSSEESL